MDFLDPKKKRAHKIRLFIGYALMAIALIIGSTILFFEAKGFDISRKTGEVIQNGLVFVDAHPEQAEVFVNGKLEGKTDLRLTIPAGEYNFELKRSGYRTWQRKFKLLGSQLLRLNYAFLFPEKLETTDVHKYTKTPSFATQSPDRKWLVVQQPDKFTTFDVFDLSNQKTPPVRSFTLPSNLTNLTAGSSKLELVEWSTDNKHILIKHSFKGGNEFLMINHDKPTDSINLNQYLKVPIYKIALRNKKFDKLHVLDKSGGTLQFVDTKTKQISTVAKQVFSFKSYGDDTLFLVTGNEASKGRVAAVVLHGKEQIRLRELPASGKYPIDITRFDNRWYLAVGSTAEKRAYIYDDIIEAHEKDSLRLPAPVAIFKLKQLETISVSANTRFICAQGNGEFAIYDAEFGDQYEYDTGLKFTPGQKAEWMDGHRLTTTIDGKLTVWDYDGINKQTLVSSQSFLPFFDRDYDFLYSIAPSTSAKGQSVLTKTPMRTPEDL